MKLFKNISLVYLQVFCPTLRFFYRHVVMYAAQNPQLCPKPSLYKLSRHAYTTSKKNVSALLKRQRHFRMNLKVVLASSI